MHEEFTHNEENISQAQQSYCPPPKRKRSIWGSIVGVAVISAVLVCCLSVGAGALGAFVYNYVDGRLSADDSQPLQNQDPVQILEGIRENAVIDVHQIQTGTALTPAQVYAKNVNSTVGITTAVTTNFWGYQTTSAASGSGFILSDDGYILTNYHVIEDSSAITVALYDGTSYDAELVGYDKSNDIAVLKVDGQGLSPVILGDSDNLNVGDSVIAIGNPLGELTFSLSSGAVSAMNRTVTMSTGATMNLLQTDCAINSGNSGGALFNLYGEVIGITNAKYSSSGSGASIDNIGFAIPINGVRSIVESIIEKGYVSKPYVGISVTDVSSEYQNYGLPQGAAVRAIAQDGPAAQAGIRMNDIVTHIDGTAISGSSDLVSRINKAKPGDVLEFTLYRQGHTLTVKVTVGEQIQSTTQNPSEQAAPGLPGRW